MNRHNIAYYFREGFAGIFKHGFMSFASVSVMIVCLVLTGTILLLVLSINATIDSMSALGDIRAYVDETYSEQQAKALEDRIFAVENVARLEFISNTQALAELRGEFEEDSWLFDGLEYDNPLRHSFPCHGNSSMPIGISLHDRAKLRPISHTAFDSRYIMTQRTQINFCPSSTI